MLILVKHKINNEYYTIYRRDKQKFLNLKFFFEPEPFNFELIEDSNEIKKVLEDKFTSKGRSEEYDPDLPSVTKIAYGLFPMDIDKEKFLIKWLNNNIVKPEDKYETELILNKGTLIHKILELWITDTEQRKKDKPLIEKINKLKSLKKPSKKLVNQIKDRIVFYIEKYLELAFKDDEILRKIANLEEIKDTLSSLAKQSLPEFIYKEMLNSDLVYSEIFLTVPNYIQGSIDLVSYKDNKFSIIDFKTTSGTDKKTGKPKFKTKSQLEPYSRQLAIYNELLTKSGMTHLSSEDLPEFYIYQIHLIGNTYKKFEIPKEMVKHSIKEVNKVLDWYWSIRNGIPYVEPENELEFLTL